MIQDLLDVFKKSYEKNGDKIILDNYDLKDGLYAKVNDSREFNLYLVKRDKQNIEYCDVDGYPNISMQEWFKQRDYYSGYLNSNKSFYDKKIHNINYLSFFVKLESFTNEKKLLANDAIKYQYYYLCNYKKFKKPQEKKILKIFKSRLQDRDRRRDILKKYKILKIILPEIVNRAKELGVKNYIKIFFDEPIEVYQKESEIYYAIKIFNDIKYCKIVDDDTYGLSDSNMGLNSKKPFLEHKSRKLATPFMVKKDDAILIKKFFDWLKFQKYSDKYPLGEEIFINRDFKEKDLVIDFDYLPVKIKKLKKPIVIKNFLMLRNKNGLVLEDQQIDELWQLEEAIDRVFYNLQLKNNYFGEVYNKLDNSFANLIYMTRDAMSGYFKKYDDRGFYKVIKKYSNYFAIEHIKKDRLFRASECLNIKFSLLKHKGESVMDIDKMQDKIIDKLLSDEYIKLQKDEFFYLCGQIAKYLINQSEKSQKTGDMLEPYLRVNSAKKLKKTIEYDYFKYKHKISLYNKKFNNALSLIMAYEGDEKLSLNMDSFLVGALSDNIFYRSSEDKSINQSPAEE